MKSNAMYLLVLFDWNKAYNTDKLTGGYHRCRRKRLLINTPVELTSKYIFNIQQNKMIFIQTL